MEQKNNNDKGAMETIKQTAKNEVNKQKNKILGKIFLKIAPYIALFFLCLLTVGVVMAIVFSILDVFKGLIGIEAEAAASTLEESQKMISITDNGYELNDEYADQIVKRLQEQKIDTDVAEFSTDDISDMMDRYIEAEIKTMYPAIGKGDVDGTVKIWRMSAETGERVQLTYMDYEEFISNYNDSILNNFSINPENFNLCIAVNETVIHYDYDENQLDNKGNGQIISSIIKHKEMEYQTSLQSYATPLNYFIAMHMVCADRDFMEDFLEMVNSKTDIEITFIESTMKKCVQVDYEGKITTVEYKTEEILVPEDEENSGIEIEEFEMTDKIPIPDDQNAKLESNTTITIPEEIQKEQTYRREYKTTETSRIEQNINAGNISEYSEYINPKQYLIETITDEGDIRATKANTWRVQSNLNIQQNEPYKSDLQSNNTDSWSKDENTAKANMVTDKKYDNGIYEYGNINEITTEWTESYNISINETEAGYELTDFIELIESYPKVKNNLESSPSLLFYLLEKNENTQELASVMKFVIYQLSGIDYGVTEEDLAALLRGATNMVGGDYIVHTEKGQEVLKITDLEILKKAFAGYSGSSEIIEHAQEFLDLQEKYKVNAVFAAAVSCAETSAGRNGHAIDGKNNWYNIECRCGNESHGRFETYDSAETSIVKFFELIAEGSYYFKQGNYTVSTIGIKYCENADAPGGWIEKVIGFMTDMYRAAGIDVSSIFGTYGTSAVGKIADLINWAESYVGSSQYLHWGGGYNASYGSCAAFVKSAYYYNGFGQLNGSCGIEMEPIGEKGYIAKNSDGTIDWAQIPVGAFLVIPPGASGADGTYGHTALYVGNGYVIEAGASTVQKNKINVDAFYDEGYSYWAIPKGMKEYMNSAEYKALISAQVTSAKGKGYTSQVTVNGRTYNEYKQGSSDYNGLTYWDGAFKDYGCGPTSLGIIASGYGINEDPVSIAEYMNNKWGKTTPDNIKSTIKDKLGLKCTYYEGTDGGTSISEMTNIIKNKLNAGKPLVIDATAGYYTDSGHYMTLLAINDKDQVYLSNPGSTSKNGWIDISTLLDRNACGRCVISIDS